MEAKSGLSFARSKFNRGSKMY